MGAIRPRLANFIQKWVYTGPSREVSQELDDVRTQWPWDSTSGQTTSVNVNSQVQLVAGVSSWWFKPETLIVTNLGGLAATTIIRFYDGNLSRFLFDLVVSSSVTLALDRYRLRGVFCVSGLFASVQSGITIRAGGLLIESIPTGPI